jgi:hypothetical protein
VPYRAPLGDEPKPWACSDCGERSVAPGRCRRCGEEPLLDLNDPDVVEVLLGQDQRRLETRRQRNIALSVPVGIAVAAGVLCVPFPVPGVARAPIVGLACSWVSMLVLDRVSPAAPRWSALAAARAADDGEAARFRADRRSAAFRSMGGGIGALLAAILLIALGVTLADDAAGRAAVADYERRMETARRWHELRHCLVARGGLQISRALVFWNEEADPPSPGPSSCDAEVSVLYVTAKRHRGDGAMTIALEKVAGCASRCESSTLDLSQVFTLRRASQDIDGNQNYVWHD